MKIAIMTATDPKLNVGGVEYYVNGLCEQFTREGHRVQVISTKKKISGHLGLVWDTLMFALRLQNLQGFDLVISNTHSLRPLIRARRVVSIFHGSGIQSFFTDPNAFMTPFSYVDAILEFFDLFLVERIVCTNENQKHFLGKFTDPRKIYVVYPGVDTELFKPALKKQDHIKRILFVGRLTRSKGFPDLLKALDFLPEEYRLVVVGENEVKKEGRVEYVGTVAHHDLPGYYAMCDVFCLPSYQEATPLSILEAMACGCPIVATPVGGIPEIVAENAGVLTPVGNPRKLAESIEKASPIDRSAVREEALKFSWRKVSETILSLL